MEAIAAIRSLEIRPTDGTASTTGMDLSLARSPSGKKSPPHNDKPKTDTAQAEQNTREKIERIAQVMDDYVKSMQRSLNIQVNADTGRVVVRVISEEDGRIIREIPPEEVLTLATTMEEMMGLLFNEKV